MTVMVLEWVFTSIFLILVVLALRAALGKRMSAGLRYALWGVVLARLLVPVQLFTSPLAGTWVFSETRVGQNVYKVTDEGLKKGGPEDILALGGQDGPAVAVGAFPVLSAPDAPKAPDAPEPPAAPDLTKAPGWLGWGWLAGSGLAALVLLLSNLRFFWKLRRERVPLEGADCPLRVYAAAGLPSPCLFGVLRPAVYVTPEAAANPDMLRHVLAHEYTHFRHGDHIWSLLRCAALAVHWWNPLVWAAARLSRRDGELACDEGALKRLGDGERVGYGNTLLTLVTAKPRPGDLFRCATTMAGDKKSLRERVSRIARAPRRALWVTAAAVLAVSLACVCAFGQGLEETPDEPEPSPAPVESQNVPEVEIAFTHAGVDGTSSFAVPEDVLEAVKTWVGERFAWDAPGGVMVEKWSEWNRETEQWEERRNPDGKAYFDRARINYMNGPWAYAQMGTDYQIWRVNYEYHTTTPEAAENLLVGGRYLTEDGWFCPTYSNSTYLIFTRAGGELRFVTSVMINDCGPDTGNEGRMFYETIAHVLSPADPAGYLQRRTSDLNRNGVPETMRLVEFDEGMGQRLELWEGDELIWSEEGYFAHAGYNALFLCGLDGEEYLLRYNPYMGQGWCTYSYKLFTLSEDGEEQAVRENSVEFDINFSPLTHEKFDPETIAAFISEVNSLLANSVQLINTDRDLLDTFLHEGRLVDTMWSLLHTWEPPFVLDESKPLLENLKTFQEDMERSWYTEEPWPCPMNETEDNAHIWLRYQDKSTQFDVDRWEWSFQPPEQVETQVVDLNHDGRDEIVFPLVWGHGTGAYIEKLYVFDAVTLEQYDTDGLNDAILNSIESTGDKDNFYLKGPGMSGGVTLNKHAPRDNPDAPIADAIGLGDIVRYTVSDGTLYCWLGCDLSGAGIGYEGYLKVWLDLSLGGSFKCVHSDYVGSIEY